MSSSIFISNIPNPVKIVRFDWVLDARRRPWSCMVVDPLISSPAAYAVYRGDLPQPYPFGMSYKSRRDIWFKIPISSLSDVRSILASSEINPRDTRGIIFRDLDFRYVTGRLTSPPSWSKILMNTIR